MAKANVDPDELVRFARSLTRYNQAVTEMTTQLRGQLRRLEGSWQDQEQAKFSQEFDDTVRVIGRFTEHAETHARTLVEKAKHIEAYLKR